MPWKCDCGDDTLDDAKTCPVCGMSKEEWSVKFDSTRNFVVTGRERRNGRAGFASIALLGPPEDER